MNTDLRDFYRRLLKVVAEDGLTDGDWRLCERSGWPDNGSYQNILAWCARSGSRRRLTVVNLSDSPSQARIRLPWDDLGGQSWQLTDELSGAIYTPRDGNEMRDPGLFVDLGAWGYNVLSTRAVPSSRG